MIGLVYTDESEAKQMLKMVEKQKKASGCTIPRVSVSTYIHLHYLDKSKSGSPKKAKKSAAGKVDKSKISGPQSGSFKHVSHMGYDSEKGFISDGVDPSWMTFLNQLQSHGVDKAVIENNMDFIKDFIREAQTKPVPKKTPPAAPAAQEETARTSSAAQTRARSTGFREFNPSALPSAG